MMNRLLLIALLSLAAAASADAQINRSDYETVLLPVNVRDLVGANGSRWETTLRVYHDAERDLSVIGYDISDGGIGISSQHTYLPQLAYYTAPGEPSGALLYILKRNPDNTHYDLRVRDRSRDDQSAGTSIPVVRETQLITRPAQLLGIPSDRRFRRLLRIYSPLATTATSFQLSIADDFEGTVFFNGRVVLSPPGRVIVLPGSSFTLRPASRDIDLDALAPQLVAYPNVTVTVQPDDASERFWAFISITNNTTNEITLVTPN